MAKIQYTKTNVINQLQLDLSKDSSYNAKNEIAIKYSNWFYPHHGFVFSLANQKVFVQDLVNHLELDVEQAVSMQHSIIRCYEAADNMNNVVEIIQQQHITVSSIISSSISNTGLGGARVEEEKKSSELIKRKPSDKSAYNSLLKKISNPQSGDLIPEKVIDLSGNGLVDSDIGVLVKALKYQQLNLNLFDGSYNKLGFPAVENLFYTFRFDAPNPRNIMQINLSNNDMDDNCAEYISQSIISGRYPHLTYVNISGNKDITSVGWESLAIAVKKVQTKTIAIKVATADILQGMKEFLTKGFNYYTKTHKVVATKEFQDELLGVKTSACEKTKDNAKEAFLTGAFVASLTTGNDVLILAAGAEAGAGALLSPDALQCYKEIIGGLQDLYDEY